MRPALIGSVLAVCVWAVSSPCLADIAVTIETSTQTAGNQYVNVPVDISLTGMGYGPGAGTPATLEALTLKISYNNTDLTLTSGNVTGGNIGWTPSAINFTTQGTTTTLAVTESPGSYVQANLATSILNLNFQVAGGVTGPIPVQFATPTTGTGAAQKLFDVYDDDLPVVSPSTTHFFNGGINAVPEPWSLAIMGLVLPGLFWYGWRVSRTRKSASK